MLETMKALVKEKDMCVLATVSDNKPHCSLMAYASNKTGLEIYMATKKARQIALSRLYDFSVSIVF